MQNSSNKFVIRYVFSLKMSANYNRTAFRDVRLNVILWYMIFPFSDLGFVFFIGLDATGPFFSRYGASLKELDFSIMTFLWNEKYGHKLASIEGKQLDYFCEPTSLKEARCLIWLLEEHRDKFPALHNALDEFFDIMGV